MTKAEYEMMRVQSGIETAEQAVDGAAVWLKRMTLEMTEAVKEGRGHDCQTQNLTSAVVSLSMAAEKLNGLRIAKKMMAAMIAG